MSQPATSDEPIPARPGFRPSMAAGGLVVGALWGASRVLGGTAGLVLEALAIATALGLIGLGLDAVVRLVAGAIGARSQRDAQRDGAILDLTTRALSTFERLVDALERRPVAIAAGPPPHDDRPRLLAGLGRAARAGRWDELGPLLDEFEARFPEDPAIAGFRDQLDDARREEVRGHLDRIDAARKVNDPDRVLELFRTIEPSLEADRRGELGHELSRWFLEVIHRRLRIVPIQAEVVRLAAEVAETFAATAEGASLRASLPMLRRAVGLCPRCAQPYAGTAAACPRCLAGGPGAATPAPGHPEAEPEPTEGPEPAHGSPSDDGRDEDWMRYNEDDRGAPDAPA